MIEATAGIDGVTLDLFLVPSPRFANHVQELSEMAGRTPNVRVRPPVPMPDLPDTLDRFDVGLFALPPTNFNHLHALPNKFFDFVQSGLAVIVGPSPDMALIVRERGLGLVLPNFTRSALATALGNLTTDRVDGWKAASCAAAPQLSSDVGGALLRSLIWELLDERWAPLDRN